MKPSSHSIPCLALAGLALGLSLLLSAQAAPAAAPESAPESAPSPAGAEAKVSPEPGSAPEASEAPAAPFQPGETIVMVPVPAGSFIMGNATTGDQNERPVHSVKLDAFLIARTELTRRQYQAAGFKLPLKSMAADDLPLTNVSWQDALVFCNALSKKEGLDPVYQYDAKFKKVTADLAKNGYRLPTEAEWEYAARAAGAERFNYAGSDRADEVSWYDNNSRFTLMPVARKQANGIGTFDQSGNVWEWCWDYFTFYTAKSQENPTGGASGKFRIVRGGSFKFNDSSSRSGFRRALDPAIGVADVGFRVVRRP